MSPGLTSESLRRPFAVVFCKQRAFGGMTGLLFLLSGFPLWVFGGEWLFLDVSCEPLGCRKLPESAAEGALCNQRAMSSFERRFALPSHFPYLWRCCGAPPRVLFLSFPGVFPSHSFALVRDERISFTFFSLCSTPTALFFIHSVACLGQCKLRPPPWRLMTSCAKQTKGGTLSIASTSAINGTTLFSN